MSVEMTHPHESAAPVDLNAADTAELRDSLPGIGPVLADRIVSFRGDHGPFTSPADLRSVPGISARLADRLVDRVTVNPPSPRAMVLVRATTTAIEREPFVPVQTPVANFGEPAPRDSASEEVGAVVLPGPTHDAAFEPKAPAPKRSRFVGVLVAALAGLALVVGSERFAERKAGAEAAALERDLSALRHEEVGTRAEVADLSHRVTAAEAAAASVAVAVKTVDEAAEARSAHIAKDLNDLAVRTKQAQARTDARVYQLDEAMKLIDWVSANGSPRHVTPTP